MSESVRYITDQQGERLGVVLGIQEYSHLISQLSTDPELLVGLNAKELQALAESKLALVEQNRLNELLERNVEGHLSEEETEELDYMLAQLDQLNTLKTHAKYRLKFSTQAGIPSRNLRA